MAFVPPSYKDLGKKARDLFSKGFVYGQWKLDAKTKTSTGVKFTLAGKSDHDKNKNSGSLETQYKIKDYGMTLKDKWDTDNVLTTEIEVEDQIAKGLKLELNTTFAPATGKKSGKFKTSYEQDYVNVEADVDFNFSGPTVSGAAVVGYDGWMAGYQMEFDTSKSQLNRSNFAVGYTTDDFTLHTNVNDGKEFGGSVYQKVNKDLETGVQLSWHHDTGATLFGVAAKYSIDKESTLRAKVNNSSQVGLSFQHKLKDGVTLTLSSLIEGKNFSAGGHKMGLGIEFDQ